VTVDGESQSIPGGPFRWQSIAGSRANEFTIKDAFDYFEGSHDGYERFDDPVTHTRSILFLKENKEREIPPLLIVRDHFNGRARHRYGLRYHFTAGCSAMARGNTVEASADGRSICVTVLARGDLKSSIEEGWVSRSYGQRELAPVALFETEGVGPQEFVTIITPCKQCSVHVEEERSEITIHRANRFDLSCSDPPMRIVINKPSFHSSV
jgi:hypothetical protein